MSPRLLVGLTGNIATGKSTVAGMLTDLGVTVIDADAVAHQVIRAGGPVYEEVVDAFGKEMVGPDGEIDRARLGAKVFAEPEAMRRLEAIVHPEVLVEVARRVAAARSAVVVEAIKLIEAGMAEGCDSLWVTTCPAEQQVRRLMKGRRLSREEAERRVLAQSPQEEKLALADVVIDTSADLAETRAQVRTEWERLLRRHGDRRPRGA